MRASGKSIATTSILVMMMQGIIASPSFAQAAPAFLRSSLLRESAQLLPKEKKRANSMAVRTSWNVP